MIYAIDMDGVLVDFVGGAAKFLEISNYTWKPGIYDICQMFNMKSELMWSRLAGFNFWSNLKKTDFADDLMKMLNSEKFIITSPTYAVQSLAGKAHWIATNYPMLKRSYLIGPCKQYCARPDICLVDDSDSNVNCFRACGGKAILVPQMWNSAYEHIDRRLEYISDELVKIQRNTP